MGETFKDKDCQVLSLSLKGGGGESVLMERMGGKVGGESEWRGEASSVLHLDRSDT